MSTDSPKPEDPMLVSYRTLRRAIGLIGIALPIAIVAVENAIGLFTEQQTAMPFVRDSISSYYWSGPSHAIFIGCLCSIGVFLWSYCGDGKYDNYAGNLACIAAVSVALFPCSESATHVMPTRYVHFTAAGILFLLLAYFCIYSFTGQDPGTKPLSKKPLRNKIYIGCGVAILASIATIALLHLIYGQVTPGSSVFWLESLAIWAFGWSWYIKGRGLGIVQG
jgi:hypothetical protein